MYLPLQLIIGLIIMYNEIGISFFLGMSAIIIVGGFNFILGKLYTKYQLIHTKEKDKRIKITTEIFNSIKFIKVNSWEEYFYDKVEN